MAGCFAHTGDAIRDRQAAGRAIGDALICNADPSDLADVLRSRLDVPDRASLSVAGLWSLPPRNAWELADATRRDAVASLVIPQDRVAPTLEAEAERQRRAWARWCRRARQ